MKNVKEADYVQKVIALAQEFKMDADDIKQAYQAKPDSLTAYFNATNEAKEDRGWYVGWAIFWGLAALPVAAYPIYKLAGKYMDLQAVEKSLRSEVDLFKSSKGSRAETPGSAPSVG